MRPLYMPETGKGTGPMDKRSTGLYNKFTVTRNDGQSGPGKKHENCEYFVLDLTHDKYAANALEAYANACRPDYPALAFDLRVQYATMRAKGIATKPAPVQETPVGPETISSTPVVAAEPVGDRELNDLIAEKIMGWERIVAGRGLWRDRLNHTLCTEKHPGMFVSKWNPAADLNDCFEALRKFGKPWELSGDANGIAVRIWATESPGALIEMGAPGTETSTLCRAMLKAATPNEAAREVTE